MRLRAFGLVVVLLLVAILILWRQRRVREDAADPTRESGQDQGSASGTGTEAGSGTKGVLAGSATGEPVKKWKGLRLLQGADSDAADHAAPDPWEEYAKLRASTWLAWSQVKIDLDMTDEPLANVPAIVGKGNGLILRIDPECVSDDATVTFKICELAADQGVDLIMKMADLRLTVGTDGVMWAVAKEGRAACEPEFIEEMNRWERLRGRKTGNDFFTPSSPELLKALHSTKQRVELLDVPFVQAVKELSEIFSVRIRGPWAGHDESKPWQDARVTVVRDSTALDAALREILEPLGLTFVETSDDVELMTKDEVQSRRDSDFEAELLQKKMAEEIRGLRSHPVHLDGSPLTAMDLAAEAAKQSGLDLKVDPVLQRSTARWEAVEAELTLGQVMDAISKGTGGECQIRSAIWPDWEGDKEGYALWLFAPSKPRR